MRSKKSDPFIDSLFFLSFVVALIVFFVSFFTAADRIIYCPGAHGSAGSVRISGESGPDPAGILWSALLSTVLFAFLLSLTVLVHELGHVAGGILCGYRPAHFCVFGVVFSFKGRIRLRFDRTALLGGYAVMRSRSGSGFPMLLLRGGPLAECVFMLTFSAFTAFTANPVTGVFVAGETVAYFLVRSLASGRYCTDSATAAEVADEGAWAYNSLMCEYDRLIEGSGRRIGEAKRGAQKNLTIGEELALYGKKEQI